VTTEVSIIDPFGGASLEAMAAHLTAPLAIGAARTDLAFEDDGAIKIAFAARRPLVLLVLARTLENETLDVSAALDGGGGLPPLHFAARSDVGTALPLYCPAMAAGADRLDPFTIKIAAKHDDADLAALELPHWFRPMLVEGELGRLIAVLGAEGGRMRRQMREIVAMRSLASARDDALDRIGAELGLPRLDSVLAWNAASSQILTTPIVETDSVYRRRLRPFRPLLVPTPGAVADLLSGPDGPVPGLKLIEPGDPLAIAVRLVAVGGDEPRNKLIDRIRADWLVLPGNDAASDAVHAARYLPTSRRAETDALRARLRGAFGFPAGAALAPRLAEALDRAGRIVAALGGAAPFAVIRAQDSGAGSRYELGLGIDLTPPAAGDANALTGKLLAERAPGADAEAEALIAMARSEAPTQDGTLGWLWHAAGLRTVHRLAGGNLYLSHMPTSGLTIDGPSGIAVNATPEFRAVFNAADDTGLNAALAVALVRAVAGQAAAGAPDFTVLDRAAAPARWATATDLPAGNAAIEILAGAGLSVPASAAPVVQALGALPDDLLATLVLPLELSNQVRAGDPQSIEPLRKLADLLRVSGIVALLPLQTPAEMLLVAGVVSLPVAGLNLGERRTTGVRWSVVTLGGDGTISPTGGRTLFRPTAPGLLALVALGYVRDGSPDPYEYRVDLPDGALLDLPRYELLMNVLERCFPVGVEINTWTLRQHHVDLDGDGNADPLPPSLARHYRRFRMQRMRGTEEPPTNQQ
jgi:hypothetical protein